MKGERRSPPVVAGRKTPVDKIWRRVSRDEDVHVQLYVGVAVKSAGLYSSDPSQAFTVIKLGFIRYIKTSV